MLDVSSTPEITPVIESSALDGGTRGLAPVVDTVIPSPSPSASASASSGLGGAGGGGAFRTKPMSTFEKIQYTVTRRYSMYRDASIPFLKGRWIGTTVLALLYLLRVYSISGFYIVTYALGIYLLNLLIGFLTPAVDPESFTPTPAEDDEDGAPVLPTSSANSDEFRPFVRRLPEFKFWLSTTRAFLISFFCTFFPFLDIPVFWPILLIYFIALFSVTMKNRIKHMIKHKYIPIVNIGKPKFAGK